MRFLAEWLLVMWGTASGRARFVGRLRAGQLVGHSLVLATLIAPAAAQPGAGASNVRGSTLDDADPPKQELRRHHIGVQVGIFNPSTDVIELGNLGFGLERSDGQTILRYRYSLNLRIDLVAEGRYWTGRGPTATSGEAKVAGGFVGPGIRVHASKGAKGRRVVPYLQGNVYYVQEMLGEPKVLYEYGFGFGVSGGVDLEVTRLISIPIEATYLRNVGDDLDDLSGLGVSVGVNFNF